MIEKFIINRTSPDDLTKVLFAVLDKQAEDFVTKLWKELIFNLLKLENKLDL